MNLSNINLDSTGAIIGLVVIVLLVLMVAKKALKLVFFIGIAVALYYLFAAK